MHGFNERVVRRNTHTHTQGLEDVIGITYCGWDYVRLSDRNEDYKVNTRVPLGWDGACIELTHVANTALHATGVEV